MGNLYGKGGPEDDVRGGQQNWEIYMGKVDQMRERGERVRGKERESRERVLPPSVMTNVTLAPHLYINHSSAADGR